MTLDLMVADTDLKSLRLQQSVAHQNPMLLHAHQERQLSLDGQNQKLIDLNT
ncbi:MAG: hypothetical protein ACWA6R_02830 [Nitrosomonas sp.]